MGRATRMVAPYKRSWSWRFATRMTGALRSAAAAGKVTKRAASRPRNDFMSGSGSVCPDDHATWPRCATVPPSSPLSLSACPSLQARQVCGRVWRRRVALRAPKRLREALERLVQRFMAVMKLQKQDLEAPRDPRGLVDGQLLLERGMQAHVQERVGLVGVVALAVALRPF